MTHGSADRVFVTAGALNAAVAVLLGAAGAHLLRARLTPEAMTVFNTALQFHIFHALGLILVGLSAGHRPQSRWIRIAGWLMLAGLLLFSGSLYVYVLADMPFMRRLTPWGGMSFIAAWLALALGVWVKCDA
jgi:uncharacterized membrane protein YgdD (TMEM256/DUF423 family)